MIQRVQALFSIRRIGGQYIVAAAVLSMLPLLILAVIVSWHVRGTLLSISQNDAIDGLRELDRLITSKIDTHKVDVLTLADYPPIDGILRATKNGGIDPQDGSTVEAWRDRLGVIFSEFGRIHPGVLQMRYLGSTGQEWLRVDVEQGIPRVVPQVALQDKSSRPYFQRAAQLPAGQCHISAIDLNVEFDRPELDKPVLRVSTPIWRDEVFHGVIVINISGKWILNEVNEHFDQGRVIFAREDGTYMIHHNQAKLWGNQLNTNETLYNDWPGVSLAKIQRQAGFAQDNTTRLLSEDGATELTLFYLNHGAHNEGWIVGLERDRADVLAASTAMNRYILITTASVGLLAIFIGLAGSLIWVKPIKQLSKAAEAIRQGDYSARVPLRRRDELGELAQSFNQMARELGLAIEVDRQRVQALAANQAKSDFLANMSHEIRTPMAAILGFAALLSEEDISIEDRTEYIQTIQRNGDHLLCLINDVLDLSKVEAGKMTVESTQTSLPELISRIASLMRGSAQQKGLDINVEQAADLPDLIMTDPVRLRQILLNLMGNAVKFTEHGSVTLAVSKQASTNAGRMKLIFEVRDTGIGIAPDKINHLFKPFSQADDSTTRKFGGTGLGLTLSKQFAQMLGGDIEIQSTPGVGSIFRLTIETTLARAQASPRRKTESHATLPQTEPTIAGRILLAEDGPDNQRLIMHHLKKMGLTVELRENGLAAMTYALEQRDAATPFDVILMDMQMPIMDGYTATQQLRSKGYIGPIIALTAHAMQGDRQRCLDAGCDGYETKPIDKAKVYALLSTLIQKQRAA